MLKMKTFLKFALLLAFFSFLAWWCNSTTSGEGRTQQSLNRLLKGTDFYGIPILEGYHFQKARSSWTFGRLIVSVDGTIDIAKFEKWLEPEDLKKWLLLRSQASATETKIDNFRKYVEVDNKQHIFEVDVRTGAFWVYFGRIH